MGIIQYGTDGDLKPNSDGIQLVGSDWQSDPNAVRNRYGEDFSQMKPIGKSVHEMIIDDPAQNINDILSEEWEDWYYTP